MRIEVDFIQVDEMAWSSKLLSSNTKTEKGEGVPILALQLASHNQSGHQVCHFSTPVCEPDCLLYSGRGGTMPKVGIARIRKTRELFRNPERFMRQLDAEVYKESLRGEIAVRLNTFSDVAWMGYKYHIDGDSIFDRNPKVQFYDYTRTPAIASRSREIANYHITISMHSLIEHHFFRWGVQRGFNFAVQFVNPEEYIGRELTIKGVTRMVVDGDKDDRRWLDPENVWVALRWKRNPKNKKGSDDCFESWGK